MAERFFILDKFNTFYDWDLILTAKNVTPPEPKTYLVDIDGMDGTLDLSESLTGSVVYKDRTVSATFWTDHGTRAERVSLFRSIRQAVHGRKLQIIEPDDPDHYFYGRVMIKKEVNNLAYAEISIECTCEPYRYALSDTIRHIVVKDDSINMVFNNDGAKIITPEIKITGSITLSLDEYTTSFVAGTYKISDIRLRPGVNIVNVSGSGEVTFTYKEADI